MIDKQTFVSIVAQHEAVFGPVNKDEIEKSVNEFWEGILDTVQFLDTTLPTVALPDKCCTAYEVWVCS